MFPVEAYTPWVKRLLAALIDAMPIGIVVAAAFTAYAIGSGPGCVTNGRADDTQCASAASDLSVIVGVVAVGLIAVFFWWNFCYRQGTTGQSIGKSVLKFTVVSEQTGQPIGPRRSFLRQLAHYVDQLICYLGYLWPLWDGKRQTFADKIVGTICIPVNTEVPQPIMAAGRPVTYEAAGEYAPPDDGLRSPPAKRNVPAIMSLVFGAVGFVAAPLGVLCGVVGLTRANRGHGGRGLSIAGLALSGAWVLAVAATIGYLHFTGAFTAYSAPRTGDCIAQIPQYSDVLTVRIVDCGALHAGEVVAVLTLPDGDYPARPVREEYRRTCASALAAYAPATVGDPSVGLYVRYPAELVWRQNGYRDVTCVATFTPARTGSIKR